MTYTDNPIRDAETYYSSLPETLGWCEFCEEPVQDTDDYIISSDRKKLAHRECVMKMRERIVAYV